MSLLMVEEEEQNNQQMEAQDGDALATATTPSDYVSNNNISILKGKRTKRQRPQSPLPFTLAPTNSSSNNGGGGGDCVNSTTTTDEDSGGPTTTEEEDTAECLLLLSQGCPKNNDHNHFGTVVPYKFTSKRYLETNTTTNGKTGIYVYQCKTCNRTFPSFQALGGHRASHRKPKNTDKPMLITSDEDEDHNHHHHQQQTPFNIRSFSASSLSLQLTTRPNTSFNNMDCNKSSPKVHECAICGTEFSSGQALGGHMRRHRGGATVKQSNATTTTANANTKTLSLLPFCPNPISAVEPTDYHQETKRLKSASVNLSLDLNLPAATEDENKHHNQNHNKIQNQESSLNSFSSQQQQQQKHSSLILSTAPTLVDCQY